MKKACVLGAGAWGSAIAMVLSDTGHQVGLWDSDASIVDQINSTHAAPKLQGINLPETIVATTDYVQALEGAQVVVSAIASTGIREVSRAVAAIVPEDSILVSATKGLDPQTLQRPLEVWAEESPALTDRLVAMSGPNFAIEIAHKLPAATVVAAVTLDARDKAQSAFMTSYLRVYTNWDVIGVELGGSFKNIIAIACGIIEGMGLGNNAQAAIISRGIAEITRLGVALGAEPLTFAGLSGLGDLVLTATGHLSRNRQAGIAVGKGESIDSFVSRTGYTVEGFTTVKSAVRLAEANGIEMPITNVVYKILYEGLPVRHGVSEIMLREKRAEYR